VAFDLNGGTAPAGFINPAKVDPGKAVTQPTGITKILTLNASDPSSYLTVDEAIASDTSIQKGLYRLGGAMSIEGWYKDGVKWNFDTTLAEGTPAFTLTAKWTGGMAREASVTKLQDAIDRQISGMDAVTGLVNTDANRRNNVNFLYVMDGSEEVNGSAENTLPNILGRLMIVGRSPSEITNSDKKRCVFSLTSSTWGSDGMGGFTFSFPEALLVIGKNVIIKGRADSERAAVTIMSAPSNAGRRGATFIMLEGSKIIDNKNVSTELDTTSGSTSNPRYPGGAINIGAGGGTFIMEGGEISGNSMGTGANDTWHWSAGGINSSRGAKIILKGGKIENNTGPCFDIYVDSRSYVEAGADAARSTTQFIWRETRLLRPLF